jgi:hypothetical protein
MDSTLSHLICPDCRIESEIIQWRRTTFGAVPKGELHCPTQGCLCAFDQDYNRTQAELTLTPTKR